MPKLKLAIKPLTSKQRSQVLETLDALAGELSADYIWPMKLRRAYGKAVKALVGR